MKRLLKFYSSLFVIFIIIYSVFAVLSIFNILPYKLVYLSSPVRGNLGTDSIELSDASFYKSNVFDIEKNDLVFRAMAIMDKQELNHLKRSNPTIGAQHIVPMVNVTDLLYVYFSESTSNITKTVLLYAGYVGLLVLLANIVIHVKDVFIKNKILVWLIIFGICLGGFYLLAKNGYVTIYQVHTVSELALHNNDDGEQINASWTQTFPPGNMLVGNNMLKSNSISYGPYLVEAQARIVQKVMDSNEAYEIHPIVDPRILIAFYLGPGFTGYLLYGLTLLFIAILIAKIFLGISQRRFAHIKNKSNNSWLVLK